MHSVGIEALKNRLSEYVRAAAAVELVLVTDRGQVVAERVAPRVLAHASPTERRLGELMRQGLLAPANSSRCALATMAFSREQGLTPARGTYDQRMATAAVIEGFALADC